MEITIKRDGLKLYGLLEGTTTIIRYSRNSDACL